MTDSSLTVNRSQREAVEEESFPQKRFTVYALYRERDCTGVSGEGVVGYVVDWPHPNDRVTLAWMTEPNVIETANSIDDLMEIHGHGSDTKLIQQFQMDTGKP